MWGIITAEDNPYCPNFGRASKAETCSPAKLLTLGFKDWAKAKKSPPVSAMRSVFAKRTLQLIAGRKIAALSVIPSPVSLARGDSLIYFSDRKTHSTSQELQASLPANLTVDLAVEEVPERGEDAVQVEEDGPMNEFLSRFVSTMREKLRAAYPDSEKDTIDGMLLVIARKVFSEMEKGGGVLPSVGSPDPSIDLSYDLWDTVWEVSKSALEETKRTRRREEMKRFLHCEDVKKMCRFASDVGIRGDMLRELRFKWANEKLEEFDFYRDLERIRERNRQLEEVEKGERSELQPSLTALPQRRGKLRYVVHGLDLSSPIWADVSDKTHDAEKRDSSLEPQPIMGKCKMVTEEILNLKEEEDPSPLLANLVDLLRPKRADWTSLLDRINQRNPAVYLKVCVPILHLFI